MSPETTDNRIDGRARPRFGLALLIGGVRAEYQIVLRAMRRPIFE